MDRELRDTVRQSLERIALGDLRDPVRLLFCEEPDARTLRGMDLFSIAEIKRPKGGGIEIKFIDRLEALRCLQELAAQEDNASGIAEALARGAAALAEEE